jgi:LacI family repressor for deo operon, udp, cdd, tsx, nupC, and nupG
MTKHSRVTIRDVAGLAGVSHQTVSRVINDKERVNPETRRRVEAAVAELGYQPNAIARFMAQGRTTTLACISPNLTDYTFASIIEGAETEARNNGYFVITASAPGPSTFSTLINQLINSRRTEGLLVINPYIDNRNKFLPREVPIVLIGAHPRDHTSSSVMLDEQGAGRLATEHLLSLGHQSIAMITGPLVEDCVQDRLVGYKIALQETGLEFIPSLVIEGDWSATSGNRAIDDLLLHKQKFTALFAQNDRMAVGAIHALRQHGVRVPEDVSVIGFDDMPLASYFDPPLTTIRQDFFCSGCEAVQLLITSIEQPNQPPKQTLLPAELINRQSTIRFNSRR